MNPAEPLATEKKAISSSLSPLKNDIDGRSISSSVSGAAKFAYTGSITFNVDPITYSLFISV